MRPGGMREHNLAVVLGEVARQQPVSRARVAAATGLTKTTVSALVADLVRDRLVTQAEAVRGQGDRGRPGSGLSLDGDHVAALGCEISVDRLAVSVLDLRMRQRVRLERWADNRRDPMTVLGEISGLAAEAVRLAGEQGLSVVGATVAVPGLLDRASSRITVAPNLGWHDVPLDHRWSVLGAAALPTQVDNEANLAAIGELRLGAGTLYDSFMLVTGEVGIGAGLVIDSALHSGAGGYAGELGHVVVTPDGDLCGCGARGCLETVAGKEALLRAAGLDPRDGLRPLIEGVGSGEPRALAAVDAAARALAVALAAAVNLLDPGAIILGGPLAAIGPRLLDTLETNLAARLRNLRGSAPPVLASALGDDSAVLGGAVAVLDAVVADPGPVMRRAGRPDG
ncbi:ROK family transcriptional regulator [Pseudonocardia broussonetiae]|uniref:ROK family transcriptional regulator n=2 Tax=Pseudonocardia broussonetiae TaxID=2736640 RepID=A0A6M6JVW4_9PSEU|nr:ROK family transcriptional regulator [Pseudonocardia broussonetiae]